MIIWLLYDCWLHWSSFGVCTLRFTEVVMTVSASRWGRYNWGPLLIGGGVVGRCCRMAEWPASVGWRFSDIGNWFPDIGKSSTFPDIGKSIPDIRKSFPDIGKSTISRYRKLIPDIGKCWIKTEMAFHNPRAFKSLRGPTKAWFADINGLSCAMLICLEWSGDCRWRLIAALMFI